MKNSKAGFLSTMLLIALSSVSRRIKLFLSDMAETFGLTTRHIWTLERGKGNSSQQMGLHGRTELRKCVYVWEKQN